MILNQEIDHYPFGYVFSDFQIENLPKNYLHKKIINKFNYYYESNSNHESYQHDDTFIIIHGHFVYLDDNFQKNLLSNLLYNYITNYSHFLDMLDLLAGRYVILIHDGNDTMIFPDATASRTTYYSINFNIASSHVHLLNDNISHNRKKYSQDIELLGITWDLSPYENIKSITPNTFVNFNTKIKKRFFPRKENSFNKYNLNEKYSFIEKSMDIIFKYYTSRYKDVTLSLTGGEDSRFTLALAKSFHDDISSFTYTVKENIQFENSLYVDVTSLDQKIVKQLLNYVPLKHQFIFFDSEDFKLSNSINKILSKNRIVEHLPFLAPYYARIFHNRGDTINIRSSIFGLSRAHYNTMNRKSIIEEIEKSFYYSMNKYKKNIVSYDIDLDKIFNYGISTLEYDTDFYDFHKLDIYFWESRIGRWMPETLNETDNFFETLNIFNARSLIELSLSFNYYDRKSGFLFNELINRNLPILNFFGKNKEENLYEQMKPSIYDYSNNFDYFILNSDNVKNKKILNNGSNILYIPKQFSMNNAKAEIEYIFSENSGYVKLNIKSGYRNLRAENYFSYEILLNNKVILVEDISQWNQANFVCIYNLKNNDIINIRVISKRNTNADSWERASRLEILNYEEVENTNISPKSITCTSPYSKTFSE